MPSLVGRLRRSLFSASRRRRLPDAPALTALREAARALRAVPATRDGSPAATFTHANAIDSLVADAWDRYGDELVRIRAWARMRNEPAFFPGAGMYDWIEAQVLYLILRRERPGVIVEISPGFGYTTGFILLAIEANRRGDLHSFDLDGAFHAQALRNFARAGIDVAPWRFTAGDVRLSLDAIPDRVDLLFIDSDHSAEFARWYVAELFPRVTPGGLIHVHDVLRYGVKPHQGDLGEGLVLDRYLRDRGVPESRYLYVSELVRQQPLKPEPLRSIARYPFGDTSPLGTNNVEQNASFWLRND